MAFSESKWMRYAYQLAVQAESKGEVPVGAVLIDEHGSILGEGFNSVVMNNDPTAHAEIIAVRSAGILKENYRLLNTTLYVTLEPCPMCMGALVQARVKRLVFAARDLKMGAAGSVFNLANGHPLNHKIQIDEGLLQKECSLLLSNFFHRK